METTIRSESTVRFDRFELDLRTRELFRDGSRLRIRGHPIDVLAILLEHPGELVTREMLRKQLWPDNTFVDFEQILNNSVGKLREALGDSAESPRFVETLPRLGYRFIASVEKSAIHLAQTPPIAEAPHAVSITAIPSRNQRISLHLIVWPPLVFVAVAFAVFAYWYVHVPLPPPHVTRYDQLTLDGRRKAPRGTDGARVYMDLIGPRRGIAQVPVSGGKVTEIPIELPGGVDPLLGLRGVSLDGSSLLMVSHFQPGEGYMLWVVGAQGHTARYLTRGAAPSFSPDSRIVAYANGHGDIFTIPVDGGEPRLLNRAEFPEHQITRTRDISWSPDGTTIRFTRWGGRIFEMSSTGANLHEWLPGWNGGVRKCCGRWTADGQFFVFQSGRTLAKGPTFWPLAQIWAVDERRGRMQSPGADPILLTSGPLLWGDPVPSRDGKKFFARGVLLRGELERYDPTSKRLEPYLGGISAEMPDFSRDGKYVAYVSFPDGILWRANRDGSERLQLTQPPFYPKNPRWSPDGTQILFTDNTQNGVDTIYVVSSQGGTLKRLLPEDGTPQSVADWSPDGTKVVYSTFGASSFFPSEDSKVETRIVELATSKVTPLPKTAEVFWLPRWSPNGRYIAGHSFNQRELAIFDLKTGKWNAFSQKGNVEYTTWSHDGRFIYFVRWIQGNAGVYRIPFQGGKEELVFDLPEGFRGTGGSDWYGFWMSLDPTDAPLLVRDVGTDEIYELTLERE